MSNANADPLMRIHRMPPQLAELVAAGEVVTSPASVVKELLENAADADSSNIGVQVTDGGHSVIRVTDNGTGMHADDLPLAVQLHTTSKLMDADTLSHIATYGFRGEALAAISTVSRLTLASATEDSKGFVLRAQGGEAEAVQPLNMDRGTRVEVSDLFFNIPARKKYLAAPKTEFSRIRRVFHQFSLARPDLALQLHLDGKQVLNMAPAADVAAVRQRLLQVVGADWDEQLIPLESSAAGMKLRGWLGSPDRLFSRPLHQYFFVNDRPIRDKVLSNAARTALGENIGRSSHPLLAVWLEADPEQLDVNVHPAKEEVRFLYSRAVHGLMRSAVARALSSSPSRKLQVRTRQAAASAPPAAGGAASPAGSQQPYSPPPRSGELWMQTPAPQSTGVADTPDAALRTQQAPADQTTPLEHMSLGTPLGQLHRIFILAENSEGLVVVDAHAAHERCLLEKTMQEMQGGEMAVQSLLMPLSLQVGPQLADTAEENASALHKIGLEFDRTGEDSLVLRTTPSLLAGLDAEEMALAALADCSEGFGTSVVAEAQNHILGNLCCRAATKANMPLSLEDMSELLRSMERMPHSAYCNHGRPSWYLVPLSELDRLCHRGR